MEKIDTDYNANNAKTEKLFNLAVAPLIKALKY